MIELKKYRGVIFKILFVILVFYLIFDFWAVTKLNISNTAGQILNTFGKAESSSVNSTTQINSEIVISNPTLVPVLFGRVYYSINYGETEIGKGNTGFFTILPGGRQHLFITLVINNTNLVNSVYRGVENWYSDKTEKRYMNIYLNIFGAKLKVQTIEF